MNNSFNESWYVLFTKNRFEKKVSDLLAKRNIESYCPYNLIGKTDKKKGQYEPLFESLLFVKLQPEQLDAVKNVSGIKSFFFWLGKPAVIKQNEIDAIKSMIKNHPSLKLRKIPVNVKEEVKLVYEPIVSRDGRLVQVKQLLVMADVPSLGYSLSAHHVLSENIKASADSYVTSFIHDFKREVG